MLRVHGGAAVEVRGGGGEEQQRAFPRLDRPWPRRREQRLAAHRHVVQVEDRRHFAAVLRRRPVHVPVVPTAGAATAGSSISVTNFGGDG